VLNTKQQSVTAIHTSQDGFGPLLGNPGISSSYIIRTVEQYLCERNYYTSHITQRTTVLWPFDLG